MADCNCKRTATAAVDDSSAASGSKRRKLQPSPSHKQHYYSQCSSPPSTMLLNSSNSCSTFSPDQSPPSSCCSSNDLHDVAATLRRSSSPLLDLEAKSFETANSNSTSANNKFSRETTPSSELCLGADEMESPSPAVARGRSVLPVSKSPPTEEMEEFFAVAEKYEQKRFAGKYNYDIVKDSPLEGRYQWVRLKP